jgi:hypothetical protein
MKAGNKTGPKGRMRRATLVAIAALLALAARATAVARAARPDAATIGRPG